MGVRREKGRFVVEFRLRGERIHRRCPPQATREQAQELESRLRASIFGQVDLGHKPTVPIAYAISQWLATKVAHSKARIATRNHANQLAEWVDGKYLDEIPQVAADYTERNRRVLKPATINRRLCVLKAVAKYSFQQKWIKENLSVYVSCLPENNKRQRYLARPQIAALLRACDREDGRAFIALAIYTGMRQSEILRLRPADIEGDWIYVRDSKIGEPRRIPLIAPVRECLAHIPFRMHQRSYYGMFQRARDAAKIRDLTYHDLRHTTASLLISAGVDLYTVGQILGHKSAQTTKRYAHLNDAALRRAMKKLA